MMQKIRKMPRNTKESRREMLCLKWAGTLFLSIVLGIAMLVFVYALPVDPMRKNVARSSGIFDYERIYPELVTGYQYMRLDNFTDSIMLGAAIYAGEKPLIERALQNYHIDSDDLPPDLAMTNYANEVEVYEYYEVAYGRYWHGYLVPLKLLLLFFDYGDIRVLNFFCQIFLLYLVVRLFLKKKQEKLIWVYLVAILVLNPLATALSLQFSTMYYIILFSSYCMLRMYREGEPESGKADDLFFITGIATSYFDFLTYPLAGAGILLVLYMDLYGGKAQGKQIWSCIRKMVLWCTGYGGMWCGKWLAGTLLTGNNFFRNAWMQGKLRTSVEDYTRLDVLWKNIRVLIKWPFVLLGLVLAFYCVSRLREAEKGLWRRNRERILLYAAVAMLPVVWICIMANHSWIHYWFTYREFAVSCFAVLSLAVYLKNDRAGSASP